MARIIGRGYSYDDVLIVPKYNTVKSREDVTFRTQLSRNYKIDNPLIAANMNTVCESDMAIKMGKLGGVGIIHRFLSISDQKREVEKVKLEDLLVAAAIGVKDFEARVPELIESGVNLLVLDIAHGHSRLAKETLNWVKKNYPDPDIMVGNIATKGAAEYFFNEGADALKVGIGPGSLCITRINTGAGVPQLTAIMDVYEATQGRIPICADGGIRHPGDVVKAIGAGADTVMGGYIFSGTDESPGPILNIDGKKCKEYMGMASYDAIMKRRSLEGKIVDDKKISVEGEKTYIEYKGSVEPIIKRFLVGIASGMTYAGAGSIDKLRGQADFIEISPAGYKESRAHGLDPE